MERLTLVAMMRSNDRIKKEFQELASVSKLSDIAHQQLIFYQSQSHAKAARTLYTIRKGQEQKDGPSLAAAEPQVDNVLSYLDQVQLKFQNQPSIYEEFLDIMKGFKAQSLDTRGMIARISVLFQDHPELILGFNAFLPDDYKIKLEATEKDDAVPREGGASAKKARETDRENSDFAELFLGKVKQRFQRTPDDYKKFLQVILSLKNGDSMLTETDVRSQVAAILVNEPDLLKDLDKFLPEKVPISATKRTIDQLDDDGSENLPKKPKLKAVRDPSIADVGTSGVFEEVSFFDEVRQVACPASEVYENFLRCFQLYNSGLINHGDLVKLATPFLTKQPALLKKLRDILGVKNKKPQVKGPTRSRRAERDEMDVDYSTWKKLGVSYCRLLRNYVPATCSGRTQLCKEVLNDTWVSFPSWSSEDSGPVSYRKTQSEEHMHRVEDERYELDIVLETHVSAIRVLDEAYKELTKMSLEDSNKFRLDDSFGGTSPMMYAKAIQRIYRDKTPEIIDGLKRNPRVAIPIVLRRMRAKEEEWREAQRNFNAIWKEETEKHYLRSQDQISTFFKQNDVKYLRTRALVTEIEERREPVNLSYPCSVMNDVLELLIYSTARQNGITKEDKKKVRNLLIRAIPHFFSLPAVELPEEDNEVEDGADVKKEEVVVEETTISNEEYLIFFATNHWYAFFRLYHLLCERLAKVRQRASQLVDEAEREKTAAKSRKNAPTASPATSRTTKPKVDVELDNYYGHFLSLAKSLVDGSLELVTYEDALREMFGVGSYIVFTLDKVLSNAVRQLGHLVTNEASAQCMDMFHGWLENRNGENAELLYLRKAEKLLEDENIFKIAFWPVEDDRSHVTIELFATDSQSTTPGSGILEQLQDLQSWSCYLDNFVSSNDAPSELCKYFKKPLFLQRNVDRMENNNFVASENLQCVFRQNSCQMSFVAGSTSFMYRPKSFWRARESHKRLSLCKSEKLRLWHQKWLSCNVESDLEDACKSWFLGESEADELEPKPKTYCLERKSADVAPYRTFLVYRVAREKSAT